MSVVFHTDVGVELVWESHVDEGMLDVHDVDVVQVKPRVLDYCVPLVLKLVDDLSMLLWM